jgi:hypothetical protein
MNAQHLVPSPSPLVAESVDCLSSLQREHLGTRPFLHLSEGDIQHRILRSELRNPASEHWDLLLRLERSVSRVESLEVKLVSTNLHTSLLPLH